MWIKYVLLIIGFIIIVLIVLVRINGYRLEKSMGQLVTDLKTNADTSYKRVFNYRDLDGLPAPVQRYLKKAIPEGQLYIQWVELKQDASLRMDENSPKWLPLKATQYFTTHPPGFIWDARVQMAPLVTARVLDMYKRGMGALRAKLFNTFTVADASGDKELDGGELLRYLAEAAWFPTALLPGEFLRWEPVDDHTALAILKDGGNEVRLKFHFNEEDVIEKATGQRYRQVEGGYRLTGWTAHYRDYQRRDGLLIPVQASVEWDLPEGNFEYWKGRVVEITYQP